ncbi:MAG: phosphoribosylaminoimidazolesuccinocarboxamide synthase [Candidatus Moraniibacteriota bacterium]
MTIREGKLIGKGKTKDILSVIDNDTSVIMRNRDEITKKDDPDLTEILPGKGKWATTTTVATFEALKRAGIRVAFLKQLSDTDFLAKACKMTKLEVIARRYADGSSLSRNPHLRQPEGQPPFRFHRLEIEFFLKTSGGKITNKDGLCIGELPEDWLVTDKKKPIDDPFITNPHDDTWILCHPKVPTWDPTSKLGFEVKSSNILPENVTTKDIAMITRKVFLVLEGMWAQLGLRLIDFKIEFGIDEYGNILVSDVIDNDSWRLRTIDWRELSKQLFRDDVDMEEVADKYALVAKLVKKFSIPRQAIVLWRGSDEDEWPTVLSPESINVVRVTKSGHKSPGACLEILEKLLTEYPEGGVIITLIGKSNGLGPTSAARTSWPVLGVAVTAETHPEDVWSNLRMPSQVPMPTMLSPDNAVLMALNILGQKNPIAYMHRQYAIEELDI